MRAIVLTGFMGTGKTEVGRRLAQRLGRAFVDTDQLVEGRAGKSVASIFAAEGEAAFRALERAVIAGLADRTGVVIAVGGGAVLVEENVRRLRALGPIVQLTASPETIVARVGGRESRPLLADGDPLATVRRLLGERAAAYAAAADLVVETGGRTADEVVEAVQQELARHERDERWK